MEYDNDGVIEKVKPVRGRPKGVRNNRRAVLADAYLKTFSIAEAAKIAGLTSTGHARRLLNDTATQFIIQSRLDELKSTSNETLIRLTDIARGAMRYFLQDGELDLESEQAKTHYHLIKKFSKTTTTKYTRDGEPIVTERIDIDTYDALAALTVLAKYHGLLQQSEPTPPPTQQTVVINNFNDAQQAGLDVSRIRSELARLMGGDGQMLNTRTLNTDDVNSQDVSIHTVDSHAVSIQDATIQD